MAICSICKKNYPDYKGLTIFMIDGKALNFCSSKCRKNFQMGRKPKKIKWIHKKKKGMKESIVEEE